MTQVRTLADLKATIADDLERTDLTSAITEAIEDAVQFFQSERFWFNQSRTVEFSTVNGQEIYTSSDDVDIPSFVDIDHVWSIDTAGEVNELDRISIEDWEELSDNSAATGEPYYYVFFNDAIYLYPTPSSTVYTIRFTGHQGAIIDQSGSASAGIGAPDNDSESNPYIRNAFELLRCYAKKLLYLHKLQLPEMAHAMDVAANTALVSLRREAAKKFNCNQITPTCF